MIKVTVERFENGDCHNVYVNGKPVQMLCGEHYDIDVISRIVELLGGEFKFVMNEDDEWDFPKGPYADAPSEPDADD